MAYGQATSGVEGGRYIASLCLSYQMKWTHVRPPTIVVTCVSSLIRIQLFWTRIRIISTFPHQWLGYPKKFEVDPPASTAGNRVCGHGHTGSFLLIFLIFFLLRMGMHYGETDTS